MTERTIVFVAPSHAPIVVHVDVAFVEEQRDESAINLFV